MRLLLLITFLLMHLKTAQAEITERYIAPRPIGMGNAFTSVANDENALRYNPAGIAHTRKPRSRATFHILKFPNLIGNVNTNYKDLYQGSGGDGANVAETISENADLQTGSFHFHGGAYPTTTFEAGRNNPMGLGFFEAATLSSKLKENDPTLARLTAVLDSGMALGVLWTRQDARLSGGITIRPTIRSSYENDVPLSDLVDKAALKNYLLSDSKKGTGVGLDAGVMYTMADFWFPTFGAAVLNVPTGCRNDYYNEAKSMVQTVCGTSFSGSATGDYGNNILDPTDVRVGVSINPRLARRITLRLSADLHHLSQSAGSSNFGVPGIEASKLLHGGAELYFGHPLSVLPAAFRVGSNQGLMTWGFTLTFKAFIVEYASYGVDLSPYTDKKEDRRLSGGFSFLF